MLKDTIVEILSILQCRKIPEGIRIRLENNFLANWKQKTFFKKKLYFSFGKKSHSAEIPKRTPKRFFQAKNVKGVPFYRKQFQKKPHRVEKSR